MNVLKQNEFKKVFVLAAISVVSTILFSFFGAPFLRAFSVSTRSRVYWAVGVVFVATLFGLGVYDTKIPQAGIYIGAIWMTLGIYNELEKRGVNWKRTGLFSLICGVLFAGVGYFFLRKNPDHAEFLNQIVEPLSKALTQAFPNNPISIQSLIVYLPGLFIASLFGALAFGFIMENRIIKIFGMPHFKVASSLKTFEFRMPDAAIWISLFSLLFSFENFHNSILQIVSTNILIVAAVAFLVQGLIVVEFLMRFMRFGPFGRAITYALVIFQLLPFVILFGFVDYWLDLRRVIRRKAKNNS